MSGALHKLADRFTQTTIDEEIVVMNLDSGEFYSLTGTARTIWELIDGTRDRAALLAAIEAEYGAGHAAIAADLDTFVDQLLDAGLVVQG